MIAGSHQHGMLAGGIPASASFSTRTVSMASVGEGRVISLMTIATELFPFARSCKRPAADWPGHRSADRRQFIRYAQDQFRQKDFGCRLQIKVESDKTFSKRKFNRLHWCLSSTFRLRNSHD